MNCWPLSAVHSCGFIKAHFCQEKKSNTHKRLKNDSKVRVKRDLSQFKLKKQTVACNYTFTSCRYSFWWRDKCRTNIHYPFCSGIGFQWLLFTNWLFALQFNAGQGEYCETISWKKDNRTLNRFKYSLKNSVRNVHSTWGNLTLKFPEKYTEHMTLFCYDSHCRSAIISNLWSSGRKDVTSVKLRQSIILNIQKRKWPF